MVRYSKKKIEMTLNALRSAVSQDNIELTIPANECAGWQFAQEVFGDPVVSGQQQINALL